MDRKELALMIAAIGFPVIGLIGYLLGSYSNTIAILHLVVALIAFGELTYARYIS
jgi:uncharacterized membrane-anchored protein